MNSNIKLVGLFLVVMCLTLAVKSSDISEPSVLKVFEFDPSLNPGEVKLVQDKPLFISEFAAPSSQRFQKYLTGDPVSSKLSDMPPGTEMRIIREQGPAENRVCLTWLGDGYTAEEKEKFFADVKRMNDQLFAGQTFASYLPLFNVYAVFVPSNESGVTDIETRDTAFRLYRAPKGSKRAIMPGDMNALEKALGYAPKTDYPIVVANDEFYGGLGGRYAITTRSEESGMMVLRHELGHNFGEVGEEYDNGWAYYGANNSSEPSRDWGHWSDSQIQTHDYTILSGDYSWHKLSDGPYRSEFTVPEPNHLGHYSIGVELSHVGWTSPAEISILLNDNPLKLQGGYTRDRSFLGAQGLSLSPGQHTFSVSDVSRDGDNVVAYAVFRAYEPGYDFTPNKISAFSTYDAGGTKTYRPTHDSCLMKDIRLKKFCAVDIENMWHKLLGQIRLIDDVLVENGRASLKTIGLKGLSAKWYKLVDGEEIEILSWQNKMSVPQSQQGSDKYRVRVQFETPEVRKYTEDFVDSVDFEMSH